MEIEFRQMRKGETQKGLTERTVSLQGQYSDREAEGKDGVEASFPSKVIC